jgi:hypothetical protein
MKLIKGKLFGAWFRSMVVILGWGASNAASAASGIFQGVLVPSATYSGGGALPISIPLALASDLSRSVTYQAPVTLLNMPFLGIVIGKWIFFLEILGVAVIASFLLEDFAQAFVSFASSYVVGVAVLYFVLIMPGLLGSLAFPVVLDTSAIYFTFVVFFPFPLFIGLAGTIAGVSLADRFS